MNGNRLGDTLIDVVITTNFELLTKQRCHLLAVMTMLDPEASELNVDADALQGILNLLDALSDAAQNEGYLTVSRREQLWAETCLEVGWPDPRLEENEETKEGSDNGS